MEPIRMVDLQRQHKAFREEIDRAIREVMDNTAFIKGPIVAGFEEALGQYLGCRHTIGCANGTDALQLALMALDLPPDAEIILPSFTFVATAEVVRLLGHRPVFADIYPHTFNLDIAAVEALIGPKTQVIVPVHLFGQCADMEGLLALAQRHQLYVVEDAAQALGSHYRFSDGREAMAGTMGHLGCTSFFPSKNLGCAGDGGAVFTNDDALAHVVRQLANHGMGRQYEYERAGINSRLDTLQAAILRVKLPRLDAFNQRRRQAAEAYDRGLAEIKGVTRPFRCAKSRHIFHQYTLRVAPQLRDGLQAQLDQAQIPNKVYYPTPLQAHACYADARSGPMTETERACQSVLSLPMHSELDEAQIAHIVEAVAAYYATAPAASH